MSLSLVKKPLITERSVTAAQKENTYTFLVAKDARKKQIAQAISELFAVNVAKVRTVATPIKKRRSGKRRMAIQKASGKKAMVTLKQGQSIDLFDIGGKS